MDYSNLQFKLDRRTISFSAVILECAKQPEFYTQIDRLYHLNLLGVINASGINKMIDKATGHTDAVTEQFVALIWYLVWIRLPLDIRITDAEAEQELKDRFWPVIEKIENRMGA